MAAPERPSESRRIAVRSRIHVDAGLGVEHDELQGRWAAVVDAGVRDLEEHQPDRVRDRADRAFLGVEDRAVAVEGLDLVAGVLADGPSSSTRMRAAVVRDRGGADDVADVAVDRDVEAGRRVPADRGCSRSAVGRREDVLDVELPASLGSFSAPLSTETLMIASGSTVSDASSAC